MPRLIDAHKLYEQYETAMRELVKSTNCENISLESLSLLCGANLIANAPTVDAVPVIRCKDCINWDTEWTTHPPEHYCPAIDQFTSADFYCGYAENKDLEEQHE